MTEPGFTSSSSLSSSSASTGSGASKPATLSSKTYRQRQRWIGYAVGALLASLCPSAQAEYGPAVDPVAQLRNSLPANMRGQVVGVPVCVCVRVHVCMCA